MRYAGESDIATNAGTSNKHEGRVAGLPAVSPTSLSPAEEEVVGALLALSRVFVAETARSLSGLDEDVTLPQFRTLVVLVSRGPQRVADLAQELAVTSSTAVRMCNRLVRKGLVARQERPDDRRVAWITLTAAGRDLVGEATRRRRERLAELVAALTMTRPLAFASVLNAMVECAGEVPDRQWWQQWRDAEISPAAGAD
jgi:DNA-binding MarR family transcriptional regulator